MPWCRGPSASRSRGPAGPAVTDGTHAVGDDSVPDVPRRAGLPRLALVAIVGGSLVQALDPAVLSEAPETAVPA